MKKNCKPLRVNFVFIFQSNEDLPFRDCPWSSYACIVFMGCFQTIEGLFLPLLKDIHFTWFFYINCIFVLLIFMLVFNRNENILKHLDKILTFLKRRIFPKCISAILFGCFFSIFETAIGKKNFIFNSLNILWVLSEMLSNGSSRKETVLRVSPDSGELSI